MCYKNNKYNIQEGVIMSYRNEDIHVEEYTLVEAKTRFLNFCNHCTHFNSSQKICRKDHRIKSIIVAMPSGRETSFLVRKKNGCDNFSR